MNNGSTGFQFIPLSIQGVFHGIFLLLLRSIESIEILRRGIQFNLEKDGESFIACPQLKIWRDSCFKFLSTRKTKRIALCKIFSFAI